MSAALDVDELAELRTEIARLQLREAALQQAILRAPPVQRQGRWYRAEVVEMRSRRFDPALLPQAIRDDPLFWREDVCQTLRCLPVAPPVQRAGWPIRVVGAVPRTDAPHPAAVAAVTTCRPSPRASGG